MLSQRTTRGFTLIEAMIALGILLAGIAGSSLLLVRSLQFERESALRRTAIRLAGTLAEELRALRRPDGAGLPADAPAIMAWRSAAASALPPDASVQVEAVATRPPAYRVTIAWPVAGSVRRRLILSITT